MDLRSRHQSRESSKSAHFQGQAPALLQRPPPPRHQLRGAAAAAQRADLLQVMVVWRGVWVG
jgi:hypothetical protein